MTEKRVPTLTFPQIEPGTLLAGRYRILSTIGKGGMGFVFAAEEESLGIKRLVAIKVLPPQMMLDQRLMERFLDEIKIASALDHPNIVPIYSLGEHQGVYFYVMKLLDGRTAHQQLRQSGPFPEETLRRLLAPIARALHYAHTKGVIHRDVKSNNIHLSADGHPTLMDFGIARSSETSDLTSPGQVVGTAEYMSPEQWMGETDARSDIYGFGVCLYELAVGHLPFRSKATWELMKLHQEEPPPSPREEAPRLSREFDRLVLKCLAKKPEDRFPTALAVAEALESSYQLEDLAEAAKDAARPLDFAAGPPTPAPDSSPTMARESSISGLLAPADRRVRALCEKADDAYGRGDLPGALKLIGKARRLAPQSSLVQDREEKFVKMRDLTDQILTRADEAAAAGKLRTAIADYESVLNCIPLPQAEHRLHKAKRRAQAAEELMRRSQELRAAGRIDKAVELVNEAYVINQQLEAPAIATSPAPALRTAAPRPPAPRRKAARRRARRKLPLPSKGQVIGALAVLALIAAVFAVKPGLLRAADYRFRQETPEAWFLTEPTAFRLYGWLGALPSPDPLVVERLQRITARAKAYYVRRANEEIAADQLGPAIADLERAAAFDPQDGALFSSLDLLRAKYQVQRSLGK